MKVNPQSAVLFTFDCKIFNGEISFFALGSKRIQVFETNQTKIKNKSLTVHRTVSFSIFSLLDHLQE